MNGSMNVGNQADLDNLFTHGTGHSFMAIQEPVRDSTDTVVMQDKKNADQMIILPITEKNASQRSMIKFIETLDLKNTDEISKHIPDANSFDESSKNHNSPGIYQARLSSGKDVKRL